MLKKKNEIKNLMLFAKNATSKKDILQFTGRLAVAQLDDDHIYMLLLDLLKEKSHITLVRPLITASLLASRIDVALSCMKYVKENKKKTFESVMKDISLASLIRQDRVVTEKDGKSVAKYWETKFTLENIRDIKSLYLSEDRLGNKLRSRFNIQNEVELAIVLIAKALDHEKSVNGKREILDLVESYVVPLLKQAGDKKSNLNTVKRDNLVRCFMGGAFQSASELSRSDVIKEIMLIFPDFWLAEQDTEYRGLRRAKDKMSYNDTSSPFFVALSLAKSPGEWFRILEEVALKLKVFEDYVSDIEYFLTERKDYQLFSNLVAWNENRLLKKIVGENKLEVAKTSMAL